MARIKRTSNSLENLKQRLAGMTSIDPKIDLGNGITAEEAERLVKTGDTLLQEYNTLLSDADEKQYAIEQLEKKIDSFCVGILASAAVKYGKDSIEYEKVGGKRTSDIKRKNSTKKMKVAPEK
jgi:hypothetical protein